MLGVELVSSSRLKLRFVPGGGWYKLGNRVSTLAVDTPVGGPGRQWLYPGSRDCSTGWV